MGIEKIWCYPTELGEKSYLESNFWDEETYRPQLVKGAGQGVTSNLPEVKIFSSLQSVVEAILPDYEKITLDNIRPENSITDYPFKQEKIALLLGSERGLTDKERDYLESEQFAMLKMGKKSSTNRYSLYCGNYVGFIEVGIYVSH